MIADFCVTKIGDQEYDCYLTDLEVAGQGKTGGLELALRADGKVGKKPDQKWLKILVDAQVISFGDEDEGNTVQIELRRVQLDNSDERNPSARVWFNKGERQYCMSTEFEEKVPQPVRSTWAD